MGAGLIAYKTGVVNWAEEIILGKTNVCSFLFKVTQN